MNKDITLEEYTIKVNTILSDKKGKEFTQEELTPLWKSLQNDDMDITFDDEIYSKSVMDFCNNNGFFAKWQRTKLTDKYTGNPLKGCWSIGIFEIDNYLENVEKLKNFGFQFSSKPLVKITKSRNDVQLRERLKNTFIRRLIEIDKELKRENKRKNKRNPKFTIKNDVIKDEDYEELESLYRYKLTSIERFDIEIIAYNYIRKYPYLREHFNMIIYDEK